MTDVGKCVSCERVRRLFRRNQCRTCYRKWWASGLPLPPQKRRGSTVQGQQRRRLEEWVSRLPPAHRESLRQILTTGPRVLEPLRLLLRPSLDEGARMTSFRVTESK